jgi:ribosomal-protein-alanine N-acetyltransferase
VNVFEVKDLYTRRFRLRRLADTDIPSLFEMDSDPAVTRYVQALDADFESYAVRMRTSIAAREGKPLGVWAIEYMDAPGFQGWVALKELPNSNHIEVGYRLPVRNWKQGIATEVGERVLRYGFDELRLKEIVAVTHPDNIASQRVLAKLGFTQHGLATYYDTSVLFFTRSDND